MDKKTGMHGFFAKRVCTAEHESPCKVDDKPFDQLFDNPVAKEYYDSLSEMDQIGVRVAHKTIPQVFCIERSSGFAKWAKRAR